MSDLNDAVIILKELRNEYWDEGMGLHTDYYITMDDVDRLDKAIQIIEKQANEVDSEPTNCAIFDVRGSLPSDEELQKVVERIAYEQHGEDQAEDCYAKMGILHEFVKTYVKK